MQIVAYILSAIGSIVGILIGFFRVYPFFKSRIAKLREAGIKPTFKRVIFLHKTLSKYRPLLEPGDRPNSLQVPSVPCSLATANAPPALLRLNAIQIGHLVRHHPALQALQP